MLTASPVDIVSAGSVALSPLLGGIAAAQQRRNMDYQAELALRNWRIQQEYNSPLNQRKRLEAAGINPNVAFQGTQTTSGSAPAPAETPQYGSLTPSAAYSQQFLQTTAQSIAALAQASKAKGESKTIEALLAGQIKKLDLENVSQDIQNQLNDFQLRLNKLYGHRRMSAETETAVNGYFQSLQNLLNSAKSGKILDYQIYQSALDVLLKDLERQGKGFEVKMLQETAKQLPARLTAEVNEINQRANAAAGSAEASRASAAETRQRTGFDKELYQYREQGLKNDNIRQILENANLANDVIEVMQDYDWNLEALEQSEKVRPVVKKFVGFIRTITRQSTKPVSDIVRGILKK